MKKFILKCMAFLVVVISIMSFVLIQYGGYVDYFYNKFTTPKAHSMILGDSRSLQGIQPKIISSNLRDSNLQLPILNYSFTLKQISYGEPYLKSIKKKLNKTSKNGLFIITVHPFTLSNRNGGNNEEDKGVFFEANMPPHNMEYVNMNPNFEYLYKNFNYFHFRGVFRKSSKTHKDGWLEETNLPSDSSVLDKWKKNQIKLYSEFAQKWKKSNTRVKYLDSTINYLNAYGKVILVRLPVDNTILNIENEYWNSFNDDITILSKKNDVPYINFTSKENKFKTYDGIHIDKFAGVPFTKTLCDSIKKHIK